MTYHSSEQFIQHRKASYFGDHITANKIKNTTTTLECKQLSTNIRNFDKKRWEKVVKDQCKPGIKCKFQQNPGLADILLKCTEDKTIVECTTDRIWGNGVLLSMDDCLDPERWISPGLLGEILEEVRSELKMTQEIEPHSLHTPEDSTMDIDPEPKSTHHQSTRLHVETPIAAEETVQSHTQSVI